MASVWEYRRMGGISMLLLALHVLFLDYEIFLGAVQYADYVRIGIVITDFLVVIGFVVIALRSSSSYKEDDRVVKLSDILETEKVNPISSGKVENELPSANIINKVEAESTKEITDNVVTTSDSIEKVEGQNTDETVSVEQKTETDVEEVHDGKFESAGLRVEGVDIEVKDEVVEEEKVDKEELTVEEDKESAKDESESENAEKADEPIDNSNIEDLIFFQKVEYLMAQKKLFCESDISREQIAQAVGTNRTYLTRSIKNATGKTFLEYITDLRTSYAATLLTTTNEPLDIIGTIAGFGSKSAYYRAFSAAFGCSPSEYRKR